MTDRDAEMDAVVAELEAAATPMGSGIPTQDGPYRVQSACTATMPI